MEPAQVWTECSDRLQRELSSREFNSWIGPLQAGLEDDVLVILAPNPYVRDQVQSTYRDRIAALVETSEVGDDVRRIDFAVGDLEHVAGTPLRAGRKRKTIGSGTGLIPWFDFDSFVVGKSNEIPVASARHVADQPGLTYNPLLFYGDSGLGKTHLMHAIGNEVRLRHPEAEVLCLTSHEFVNVMVAAIRAGTMSQLMDTYRAIDVLLIDDIHFFTGEKVRSQEEFFHLFNALHDSGRQIVLTSDRYPSEIDGLEERLKSRFAGGMTAEIRHPDIETRVAILCKKAESMQIDLPADDAFYIAERIRSNVRELEGALRRLWAAMELNGTTVVTRAVLTQALGDIFARRARQLSIEQIQRTVAKYYNIKYTDMLSPRRNRTIARPRQMAMFLAREFTKHSLWEIGNEFSGRDHTTVLYACRQIETLKEENADMAEDYQNLVRELSK